MKTLVTMVAIALSITLSVANNGVAGRENVSAITEIENADAKVRIKAADDLVASRKEIIQQLVLLVKSPAKTNGISSSKEIAIDLLGDYRAYETVDILIDNIDYHVLKMTFSLAPASGYPSVQALVKIGVPSLNAIVVRLEKPCSEKEMKLFANVFRLIDGEDLAILRAELALKKADGQKKKNLEQLLELLKAGQWYF